MTTGAASPPPPAVGARDSRALPAHASHVVRRDAPAGPGPWAVDVHVRQAAVRVRAPPGLGARREDARVPARAVRADAVGVEPAVDLRAAARARLLARLGALDRRVDQAGRPGAPGGARA